MVAVAEIANAAAGDSIAEITGLPYPGGVVAFALPALAGFFHRRDKKKQSQEDSAKTAEASTPREMAASVSDSRKSIWRKLRERLQSGLASLLDTA